MDPKLCEALRYAHIASYVEEKSTRNCVSYRFTGDPYGSSQTEQRYNQSGVNAFYIADREQTARHEKKFNFAGCELYQVEPESIKVFNATRFASDWDLSAHLTGARDEGAYTFCQDLATFLTGMCGISGVAYPSRQMELAGLTGWCVALLPESSQLDCGKLRIFEKRP